MVRLDVRMAMEIGKSHAANDLLHRFFTSLDQKRTSQSWSGRLERHLRFSRR